jgi:leucyl aminopeptidase (aminopeptidase T)
VHPHTATTVARDFPANKIPAKTGDPTRCARGANASLVHIDWMIGSAAIDTDGFAPDGAAESLMRRGDRVG